MVQWPFYSDLWWPEDNYSLSIWSDRMWWRERIVENNTFLKTKWKYNTKLREKNSTVHLQQVCVFEKLEKHFLYKVCIFIYYIISWIYVNVLSCAVTLKRLPGSVPRSSSWNILPFPAQNLLMQTISTSSGSDNELFIWIRCAGVAKSCRRLRL